MLKSLHTLTLAMVALAALVPVAASAQSWESEREERMEPRHLPRPPERADGTYELRTTEVWVPGYTERVWVENDCRRSHRHGRRDRGHRCGGHYETLHRPGRYEQREEWVWVAHRPSRPRITVRIPTPVGIDIRMKL